MLAVWLVEIGFCLVHFNLYVFKEVFDFVYNLNSVLNILILIRWLVLHLSEIIILHSQLYNFFVLLLNEPIFVKHLSLFLFVNLRGMKVKVLVLLNIMNTTNDPVLRL
jgi:hypothetical protein